MKPWEIFAAIAELYGELQRWPTAQEFAAHTGTELSQEVVIELGVMGQTAEELVDRMKEREHADPH